MLAGIGVIIILKQIPHAVGSYEKIVIDLDDSLNPLGFIEAGRLFISSHYEFQLNADWGARGLGIGFWKGGDQGIIEGGVVNASWKLVGLVSKVARLFQTGYLYHYALVMIAGLVMFLTYFVWLAK
jgi:NADH:ubiquinone oxidoreductase subunit 5 (subunit L)/multisubunit Na+/H+ antiporter MnhA subunit